MNFDEDPLGSDDSFFEEPKALNRRASITKTSEKKSFENLFNLTDSKSKDNTESVKNVPESSEKLKNVTFEEPIKNQEINPKPIITDSLKKTQKKNEDWLGESDNVNLLDKKAKKTDFLDDFLSVRPSSSSKNKKVTSFEDILKESKLNVASKPSSQLKETPTPTEATSNFSLLSNTSKERRRPRRGSSTAIEDTLGLFGDEYQSGDYYNKDKKETTSKSPTTDFPIKTTSISEKGVPDWLGGGSLLTSIKPDTEFTKKAEKDGKDETDNESKNVTAKEQEGKMKNKPDFEKSENDDVPLDSKHQQINMELKNTYASLQQQESFLLISLQLKKYEDNLQEIKLQQREILGKQEKQFNTLLDKYIMKQQMIDDNIRLQQERINNHVQMLISYPNSNLNLNNSNLSNSEEAKVKGSNEDTKYFESFISSLKQRHQDELFIMEESYRKQISLIEKSTEILEERLNNEIVSIRTTFEEKIDNINRNYKEEITYYKQKINTTEEQHNNEIKLIRENHGQSLEDMKREHAAQIEYLKQFKQQENELLKDGIAYSQKIDTSIDMLNSNTKALQVVQEKLINNYDVISVARENSIESKEKEIILMRNALEKCREAAENERSQLLALIRSLETKIAEQNNNAREERWALQQASATLVARSSALDREAEYNRTIIEREREQLKTLKESLLAEQEKIILQLTEEKLLLSTERARMEASNKLTNNYETERIKAEAETAIQVAKELTLKINQERDYLHRQKSEMDILRRQLADRENELKDKEMELEYLTQNAQKKINDDRRIISEARKLENQYKERLQELQSQWISLSNREKKLVEEKVLLSKERLALYTTMKQAKGCVLCKANDLPTYNEPYQTVNIQDDLLNNKMLDADTIRFRLDTIEDEKSSEVSKEENNVPHDTF